jgi:hypothetical protein
VSTLTVAAALIVASVCQPGDVPRVDPNLLVKVAQHESGLQTDAVNVNRNGTRDIGLMQINEQNFGWLGVTARDLVDPRVVVVRGHEVPRGACLSAEAGTRVLMRLSAYNSGNPTKSLAYAASVITGGSQQDLPQAARPDTAGVRQSVGVIGKPSSHFYDEPGDE